MSIEKVQPAEVYEPIGQDGWYILNYGKEYYLCEPMKGGHKSSVSHRCRDRDDCTRLYTILRERERKARRIHVEIPNDDMTYMIKQLDNAIVSLNHFLTVNQLSLKDSISNTYASDGLNSIGKVKTLLETY